MERHWSQVTLSEKTCIWKEEPKFAPSDMANERKGKKGEQRVSQCVTPRLVDAVCLLEHNSQSGRRVCVCSGGPESPDQSTRIQICRMSSAVWWASSPIIIVGLVFLQYSSCSSETYMETARSPFKALQRFESSKRIETSCSHPNTTGFSGEFILDWHSGVDLRFTVSNLSW